MSSSLYYIWFLSMVLTNYGYVSNWYVILVSPRVILASTNYSPSIYSAIWKQSVPISFWSELRHNSAICKQSLVLSFLSKLRNNSNQLFFYLLSKYHSYLKLVPKWVFLSYVPYIIQPPLLLYNFVDLSGIFSAVWNQHIYLRISRLWYQRGGFDDGPSKSIHVCSSVGKSCQRDGA